MKSALKPLLITFALIGLVIAGFFAWQHLRWQFASPLALAFHDQQIGKRATHSFSHAEVRKFISLNPFDAEKLANEAGFDCKAFTFAAGQAVCYRDIFQGMCSQLWRVQLVIDTKTTTVSRATASIRQTCLW
jgi:hypothetical protein